MSRAAKHAGQNGHPANNGHVDRVSMLLEQTRERAELGLLAGIAFDLSLLKQHTLTPELARKLIADPLRLKLLHSLMLFAASNPAATSAPASALCRFMTGNGSLRALLRLNDAAIDPDTISQAELVAIFQSGPYDAQIFAGNLQMLRAAAFERERRPALSHLDQFVGTPSEFSAEADAKLAELKALAGLHEERSPFEVISAAELATNEYPLNYMIPGILVERQPFVVGGAKKSLKTTLLIALVLALSSGCKFLNEFYVTRRYRCGLMSGESGLATIKETSERIARTTNWPNLADYDLVYSTDLPKLGTPDVARRLIRFIRDNGLEFLAFDPLYLAMQAGDGAGNLYAMGDRFAPLAEVIAETGCTIGPAHHGRKVQKSDFTRFQPPELDDLSFAGISEFVRQWLLIGRREEYDPSNGGHHALWLVAGGSAGHSGLWAMDVDEGTRQTPGGRFWEVTVNNALEARQEQQQAREAAKAAKAEERRQQDEQKLLEAYERFPNGATGADLGGLFGWNGVKFAAMNAVLLQRGDVVRVTIPKGVKGNRSWDGFRHKKFDQQDQ